MPGVDHFPSTHGTWIGVQLDEIAGANPRGGLDDESPASRLMRRDRAVQALRDHIVQRYTSALHAYVSHAAFRSLGEQEDLVGGFYAKTLADPEFLLRWRQSGMPLRRWLMNAMRFHCLGLIRDRARDSARTFPANLLSERIAHDAKLDFDRQWALGVVNEAYARVQSSLRLEGRSQDDSILRMHVIDGMSYESVAQALGLTRQECFNAVRRAGTRFRAALRDALRDEGVPEHQLEGTIAELAQMISMRR